MHIRITRAGIKSVARFIVARAVGTSVSLLIHNNTDPESKLDVVSVHVGAFVIGEWAGDAIKPYVDSQIDWAADLLQKPKQIEAAPDS